MFNTRYSCELNKYSTDVCQKRAWAFKLLPRKNGQDLTINFKWASEGITDVDLGVSNLGNQAQNKVISREKGIQISN